MGRIRSKDTKPEIVVRRALHIAGYRFRLHCTGLPGRPDIVLKRYRTVVQVRGCFWHGHTCFDGHIPKSRGKYWVAKIGGNRRRDARNDRRLRALGWKVCVVWACRCDSSKRLVGEMRRIERVIHKS